MSHPQNPQQPATGTKSSPFEEVTPWHEPVDPCALLDQIRNTLRRHIVADAEVFLATTLWIAMTYLIELFDIAALLIITAPEMRCGKSEFKRLIGRMVSRPVHADNMTAAVLFRVIELYRPTFLIDEYDAYVKGNEELRGIFNAGHQRGGCVWRCVGEDFAPTPFNVFGPKVLAGIGKLPPTLIDRAIILQLRRKLPTEIVLPQREVPAAQFQEIQSKLIRMAQDHAASIAAACPTLPEGLSDRAYDNWRPLFQIAHVAGGDWPLHARNAALKLSRNEEDTKTLGVELLGDIEAVFGVKKAERLTSFEIINALCEDEDKRWATYNRGESISPAQVAKQLRQYGIISKTIRAHGTTLKGYFLSQFSDAFARYLYADQSESVAAVTPSPGNEDEHANVTSALRPSGSGVTCASNAGAACDGVTAEAGEGCHEPRNAIQELVLSEMRAILLQERLNSLLDDSGVLNTDNPRHSWPDGLPFEALTNQVRARLQAMKGDRRHSMIGIVCQQLVERGDLSLYEGLVDLPA